MTGFGILHASGLALSIEIDADPAHIKLVHDAGERCGRGLRFGSGGRVGGLARRVWPRSLKRDPRGRRRGALH